MKKKTVGVHELQLAINELKKLKSRYDKLEPATKKKVKAGLAGAAALLLSVQAVKRHRRRKQAS